MKAVNRGDIYHRFFNTTKPPKSKFFVIIGEDENNYVGYFFINSNISHFIDSNPDKQDMQFSIKPDNYDFLTHLSFIAGHELLRLKKTDLIYELSQGITQFKGRISDSDMEMLLDAAMR